LVIAAFVQGLGMQLYFCEPPKTVVSKLLEEYASAGAGYSVTDSLHSTLLFRTSHLSPQLVLRQIAYLMYRAKKELASFCGGDTTAYYICEDGRPVEMVCCPDFAKAEKAMSQLDCIFEMTMRVALGSEEDVKPESENVALTIAQSKALRDVVFHNLKLEPIEAPIMPQCP